MPRTAGADWPAAAFPSPPSEPESELPEVSVASEEAVLEAVGASVVSAVGAAVLSASAAVEGAEPSEALWLAEASAQ